MIPEYEVRHLTTARIVAGLDNVLVQLGSLESPPSNLRILDFMDNQVTLRKMA